MQLHLAALTAALCVAFTPQGAWAAAGAEIVLVEGKGERRNSDGTVWVNAVVKDTVPPGGSVRTLANSQMGVLMSDRTQVRLNQNSELQIKSMAEATQWSETNVRLAAGRAWSQARPQTAPGGLTATSGPPPQRVKMDTPTATIGIRGTDWEVEVEPDGRTRVAVLSGDVEVANAQGSVRVATGEGALAEAGKAPVKFTLVDPQSRVQWVSSWRAQPARWGADESVRRADELLAQGEVAAARALLEPLAQGGRGDPMASALLAHALARQDRIGEAQALLGAALAAHPGHIEVQLAIGDLAILEGDAARARAAYQGVLNAQPGSVDALYGLGVIASENERVAEARAVLGQALAASPQDARVQAELAAAETFAGNLAQGERLLAAVLQREPSNYQALTALGLNRLKAGQIQAALDDFLKAGLIEPRYARAWLYAGVAFYRLGERERAMQAFARASQLDARDPLPYMMRSMALADALAPGAAIAEAREAQARMPFLKSLNALQSNQKGSANLGSSLANFGLEEWAGFYASQAQSPWWGASHLFLADRYTGRFNRNSELFQGYLTEPTAFGASNRESTLVTAPGHYGRIDLVAERTQWSQGALIGTANGLTVQPVPIAYYLSGDFARADSRDDASTGRARNFTLGLGMRPTWQLGLFAFATDTSLQGDLRGPALANDALDQRERRADAGLNFKLQPDNQLWLKAGRGSQHNAVSGALVSQPIADSLNNLFATNVFGAAGSLPAFDSRIGQRDLQFRHAFARGPVQWSWGIERSTQEQDGLLSMAFAPATLDVTQAFRVRAADAYVSARWQPGGGHAVQADLFHQRSRVDRADASGLTLQVAPPASFVLENSSARQYESEFNPRVGVQWAFGPLRTVRAVVQRWRRPASVGTLAPLDTVGIAPNDRLVLAGGLYERARVQLDAEVQAAAFVRAFADHERIDNGPAGRRTAISDFELTQLENLRTRPDVFAAKPDLEETPQFREGRVSSFGAAWNALVTPQHSVGVRYLLRDAQQTGANAGLAIPFVPRHFVQAQSQWAMGGQWLFGLGATWRSTRFRDDANLLRLDAGWALNANAYWESADRRSVVQAIVGNVLSRRSAGREPDPQVTLRYAYRF